MHNTVFRNFVFTEAEVPALTRISQSNSTCRAMFWSILFCTFFTMCVISVTYQYSDFMSAPMTTEVGIVNEVSLPLPNMTFCLSGWPTLSNVIVWWPDFATSKTDGPSWTDVMGYFGTIEMDILNKIFGKEHLMQHDTPWPYIEF